MRTEPPVGKTAAGHLRCLLVLKMDTHDLDRQVAFYQGQAFSLNTKRTYSTQLRSYLAFRKDLGFPPFPASPLLLCHYAAFLSRRLKYSSIKQYFSVIVLLHKQWGLENPCLASFMFKQTLQGIRRVLGDRPCSREPITISHLSALLAQLNVKEAKQAMIWAAALLMFFGLLRRSNVLCSKQNFDPSFHLRRSDITFSEKGLTLLIRWSKTDQFRTRRRYIPYPRMKGHPLCPTSAVYNALILTKSAQKEGPAFPGVSPHCFSRIVLEALRSAGVHTEGLGSHSFRRGGATFLWSTAGVHESKIREQNLGDWASTAYVLYTISTQEALRETTEAMAKAIRARD